MADVPIEQFTQLIVSHPVLLLSTRSGRYNTVAPLTWYVPVGNDPPMIGISLKPSSMSYRYLRESGDFILGIPDESLLKTVHFCGVHSGRDVDKMLHLNLTTSRGKAVSPLMLTGCVANMECRVRDILPLGNRPFITGEILSISAESQYYLNGWLPGIHLIYYVGGNCYQIRNRIQDMSAVRPGYVPPDSLE